MSDFIKIERLFLELIAKSSSLITSSEQGEIQHFIDVGEYGLALETVVDIFAEKATTPSEDILSTVAALANCMSMDLQAVLDPLRQSQ
jgi:hypothetical protein